MWFHQEVKYIPQIRITGGRWSSISAGFDTLADAERALIGWQEIKDEVRVVKRTTRDEVVES
jgi:hypothetical protein